jgi:hypothetical protein
VNGLSPDRFDLPHESPLFGVGVSADEVKACEVYAGGLESCWVGIDFPLGVYRQEQTDARLVRDWLNDFCLEHERGADAEVLEQRMRGAHRPCDCTNDLVALANERKRASSERRVSWEFVRE